MTLRTDKKKSLLTYFKCTIIIITLEKLAQGSGCGLGSLLGFLSLVPA